MPDLSAMIIAPDMTIIEAMSIIDKNSMGIAFVCDGDKLVATLSDGDVRRHILKGSSLDAPVMAAAHTDFKSASPSQPKSELDSLGKRFDIRVFPILDEHGNLVDLYRVNGKKGGAQQEQLNLPVVIMAGGRGTRLHPYTKVLPKPLIPIGDATITEHIMNRFLPHGCDNFTMIVNHKKNMIKAYFADEDLPYRVSFVDEDKPLGTGGGLKLLKGIIGDTFFMTNCDVLIFEDYGQILEYHREHGNLLTMVCSTKSMTLPYGTVEAGEGGQITALAEKPQFSFLTNTGFYVIEPDFFDYIPDDTFIHITDIIKLCMDAGRRIGMYPISEDAWSDMGEPGEMERMRERLGR